LSQENRPVYRDLNLQIIFAVTLMAVLGVSSITPAFPKIGRVLNLSSQSVGLLVTAFTLPGVALTPVLGVLADRWGRKRILVPALLLFGVAGGACFLARDFRLLLVLRFFQGIGAASLGSLNVTIIGDLYSGKERTAAMGYNASVLSVGTASYPAIGGALATLGWRYPFILPLVAIPIGLAVLWHLDNPEPQSDQHLSEYLRHAWESVRRIQVVGLFAAGLATFIMLYGAYLTYLPFLMAEKFQAEPFLTGIVMSTMSGVTALTSSQVGRLTKRWSERTLLRTAFTIYALALALIPFTNSVPTLLIPIVLYGIGQGLNIPSSQTLLASMAPMAHRAAFMSLNGMVLRLGQTLGPLFMGMVFSLGGTDLVFWVGGVVGLITVALIQLLVIRGD
jgi:predicted MFS family arabinose efflux permease